MKTTHPFFATCAAGTEGALAEELRLIGLGGVEPARGGVRFSATIEGGMRACLWSRMAARVLLELGSAQARDAESLYEGAAKIAWEDHIQPDSRFAVRATLRRSSFNHSGYVALKVKDALVDRMRSRRGRRPDVSTRTPDVSVAVHVDGKSAGFYLDMAGEPLHRRGWRAGAGKAPLKESLAAAVLRLGGYQPALPLCDPMCGSGTLAIEAALAARRVAPGLGRGFGFERWPSFGASERAAFRKLREVVESARKNAARAGVSGDVRIDAGDARSLGDLPASTQIFTNPPYGERLGRNRLQLEGLYRQLGESWLQRGDLERVVVLTANQRLEGCFGRRPEERHELFNGPLRSRLLVFLLKHT
ncbi:MAG: THUMP domain-containing class I SAM-dependent RNA methyltransferase [Myxococcota bacterium]